ncbi:Uncharacterised protein [Klebsiella variicola]|nr:Uncharacterised protein [Klebsiella variicola]
MPIGWIPLLTTTSGTPCKVLIKTGKPPFEIKPIAEDQLRPCARLISPGVGW